MHRQTALYQQLPESHLRRDDSLYLVSTINQSKIPSRIFICTHLDKEQSWHPDETYLVLEISFQDAAKVKDILDQVQSTFRIIPLFINVNQEILDSIVRIKDPEGGRPIEELVDLISKKLVLLFPMISTRKSDVVARFVHLAQDHFKEKKDIEFYCKALLVSEDILAKECKNFLGIGPKSYIINRRIEYAKYQLTTTGRPVKDICYNVGLEDVSHFVQIFKNKVGITPEKYRHMAIQSVTNASL